MDDLFDYYFYIIRHLYVKKILHFFLQMTCFIVVCYKWQSFRFYTKNLVFFYRYILLKTAFFMDDCFIDKTQDARSVTLDAGR